MKRWLYVLFLLVTQVSVRADDSSGEVEPCSFVAHTPVGTLAGTCATQNLPTPGFREFWKLTLTFDQQSADRAGKLASCEFYDMFRSQGLEDGSSTIILPLWGDLLIMPAEAEYRVEIQATAPLYETRPHKITISQINDAPLTIEFRFEENSRDFDPATRLPSLQWMANYLESFRRLATNRPNGFSN